MSQADSAKAIWQNWYFGQFYHSKVEVLQNCSGFFCADSLVRGKSERKFKTKQSSLIQSFQTYVNIKSCQIVESCKL